MAVLEQCVEGIGKSRIREAPWRSLGCSSVWWLRLDCEVLVKMGVSLRYILKLEWTVVMGAMRGVVEGRMEVSFLQIKRSRGIADLGNENQKFQFGLSPRQQGGGAGSHRILGPQRKAWAGEAHLRIRG